MTRHSTVTFTSLAAALLASVAMAAQAQAPAPGAESTPKDKLAVEAAFKRADVNKDGKLSRAEAEMLPGVAARFDAFDKDKKGYLTFDEFAAAVAAPAN